jgi:hypothetical protein
MENALAIDRTPGAQMNTPDADEGFARTGK